MGGIIVRFYRLEFNANRKKLFEHLINEMSADRTKHKILPPSRFGLIQITRQRVRPVMSIKTNEPNPNVNGEVEAPIVLIDKINTELSKITKNKSNTKEKIFLHTIRSCIHFKWKSSLRLKWYFNTKSGLELFHATLPIFGVPIFE